MFLQINKDDLPRNRSPIFFMLSSISCLTMKTFGKIFSRHFLSVVHTKLEVMIVIKPPCSLFSLKHNCKVFTSCPTSSLQPSLPHLERKVALLQVTCYCDNHCPNHWVPHAIVVHESSSSLTTRWGGEVWDCIFHADELNANFLNAWMTSLQICGCFGSLSANFLVHSFLMSTEIAWRQMVGQCTVLNFLGLPRAVTLSMPSWCGIPTLCNIIGALLMVWSCLNKHLS